jgi:Na+-translocating ferredoxin:NAD+ oxidoreductase subunit B
MPKERLDDLFDRLDACLPQLQCGQCGHGGCRPYAQAMVQDAVLPNRCPPGGEAVLQALKATGFWPPESPALLAQGVASDCGPAPSAGLALIDEKWCIGCTKCIAACPVDAIIGANKKMHTVLQAVCTGCDLCLPVCPVDCIALLPRANALTPEEQGQSARRALARRARTAGLETKTESKAAPAQATDVATQQAAIFAAVLARARSKI